MVLKLLNTSAFLYLTVMFNSSPNQTKEIEVVLFYNEMSM